MLSVISCPVTVRTIQDQKKYMMQFFFKALGCNVLWWTDMTNICKENSLSMSYQDRLVRLSQPLETLSMRKVLRES